MPTELKIPNLGDGVDAGSVLEILVKVGDTLAKDQGIIEVEAGKATLQIPAEQGGKVTKVHVAVGQAVKPGDTLVSIEGEPAKAAAPKSDKPAPAGAKPAVVPAKPAPAPASAKPAASAPPAPKAAP